MANLNLANSNITNVYFGNEKAKFVFLGSNLLHINDASVYTAGNLTSVVDTTINGGTASLVHSTILEAPGA